MKKISKVIIAGALSLVPLFALGLGTTQAPANSGAGNGNFYQVMGVFNNIISVITPFIIGLAVLVIIWGLFNYIAGAGDEEKRAQAKQYIIWGIIGLFVMVSIWGLVGVVSNTFNLSSSNLPVPQVVPCSLPSQHWVLDSNTGTGRCM